MNADNTILVPVDFEDASLEALAVAREFGGTVRHGDTFCSTSSRSPS